MKHKISLWTHDDGNSFTFWEELEVDESIGEDLIKIFSDYEKVNYYPFNMVLIYNETLDIFIVIDEDYNLVESFDKEKSSIRRNEKHLYENQCRISDTEVDFEFTLPTIEVVQG